MDSNIKIEIERPHNGREITRIAISPQSKYVVTYSQEDKSFVGWHTNKGDSKPLILDDKVQPPYEHELLNSDFNVSDKKIIMYEDNNKLGNYIPARTTKIS